MSMPVFVFAAVALIALILLIVLNVRAASAQNRRKTGTERAQDARPGDGPEAENAALPAPATVREPEKPSAHRAVTKDEEYRQAMRKWRTEAREPNTEEPELGSRDASYREAMRSWRKPTEPKK